MPSFNIGAVCKIQNKTEFVRNIKFISNYKSNFPATFLQNFSPRKSGILRHDMW